MCSGVKAPHWVLLTPEADHRKLHGQAAVAMAGKLQGAACDEKRAPHLTWMRRHQVLKQHHRDDVATWRCHAADEKRGDGDGGDLS